MVCSDACPPFWLILYQVQVCLISYSKYFCCYQDPMNFGAILRCAYFFGVDKVVISDRRYVIYCINNNLLFLPQESMMKSST